MMFPMVLPLPRTSISFGTGFPACFLAQTGSASMASGLSAGAFPSKVTVPVMVDAATATPGQTNTATSPAASHNLFPVPRMLSSLVIANLASVVTVDAALSRTILERADSTPGSAIGATLAQPRSRPGSDGPGPRSALRRSRRRAIRQASGRAVVRAPAVASASSPPPRSIRRRRRARRRQAATDGAPRDGASA